MPNEVGALGPIELRAMLSEGRESALLDVREPAERALCRIAASSSIRDLFIPMNELPARLDEIRAAAGVGPLVVYCHHGVRSLTAARWLVREGFTEVFNLEGGIEAWSLQVDPGTPRY